MSWTLYVRPTCLGAKEQNKVDLVKAKRHICAKVIDYVIPAIYDISYPYYLKGSFIQKRK